MSATLTAAAASTRNASNARTMEPSSLRARLSPLRRLAPNPERTKRFEAAREIGHRGRHLRRCQLREVRRDHLDGLGPSIEIALDPCIRSVDIGPKRLVVAGQKREPRCEEP